MRKRLSLSAALLTAALTLALGTTALAAPAAQEGPSDPPAGQEETAGPRWHREIDGKHIAYSGDIETPVSYSAPPAYRPTWTPEGWSLVEISNHPRNYTAKWMYQGNDGERLSFYCAYPSGASFGLSMRSEEAAENRRILIIQGCPADYYEDEDGYYSLLTWENDDGVLFWLLGTNLTQDEITRVAESTALCTDSVDLCSLSWFPGGYWLMDLYQLAGVSLEHWVRDGIALTWMYSASPIGLPSRDGADVRVGPLDGTFWEAEEPCEPYTPVDKTVGGASITSISIPADREMNTLAWEDPDAGIYFRLQSILPQEAMIRMAKSVQRLPRE